MVAVNITVGPGLQMAVGVFERISLHDSVELMEAVGQTMKLQNTERFAMEVDPDGAAWKALAASTIAQKGSSGILKDTGALSKFQMEASSNQARVGTSVFYGVFHQHGGHYKGKEHPPRRAFLGINDQDVAEIAKVVEAYFASKVGL